MKRIVTLLCLLPLLAAGCKDTTGPGAPPATAPHLPGDPNAPAASAVPRLRFEPRPDDYTVGHPELPGTPLSFNTLLLVLQPAVSTGQANALLDQLEATLVGAIPGRQGGASGVLFLRIPSVTHAGMAAALETLRQDARVRHAAPDVILAPRVVSRPNAGAPAGWTWGLTPAGGNWGMEAVRAPQMWNLNEAIRKHFVPGLLTAVLDGGFENAAAHPDIDYVINQTPGRRSRHGTHVAGIIGAGFDNGIGVDGINPFARLVVRADATAITGATQLEWSASWGKGFVDELEAIIRSQPDIRVVNLSMGYPWSGDVVNTTTNLTAQQLASEQGAIFKEMLASLVADGVPLPVIVTAAGNESADGGGLQLADYGSPMNNAALEHGAANIIVVESDSLVVATGAMARSSFSNIGGHLSAPGTGILSLDTVPVFYNVLSGTSMAAPLVTGLVGFLYRLDPALPHPTLTSNPIRDLLQSTAVAKVGSATRHIDAFAAALAIDSLRGNDRVLRMLVDFDDGTPDGNRRLNADSSVNTADARGDGKVDMRDFRRWRDWLLQAENPAGLQLDGAADHPKKDLNGDGTVGTAAEENVYPRGDFNGDGILSRTATRAVPGFAAAVTDLEVLQKLFEDPHYAAAALPDLIDSGDLEIDAEACLQPGVAEVRSSLRFTGGEAPQQVRTHTTGEARHVYTARVHPGGYTAHVEARSSSGALLGSEAMDFDIALGGDRHWRPNCGSLVAEITMPDTIEVGTPMPVLVRVGRRAVGGAAVQYGPGYRVDLEVSDGTVTPAAGTTDADGYVSATVTVQHTAQFITLFATARTDQDEEVTVEASAAVVRTPGVYVTCRTSSMFAQAFIEFVDHQANRLDALLDRKEREIVPPGDCRPGEPVDLSTFSHSLSAEGELTYTSPGGVSTTGTASASGIYTQSITGSSSGAPGLRVVVSGSDSTSASMGPFSAGRWALARGQVLSDLRLGFEVHGVPVRYTLDADVGPGLCVHVAGTTWEGQGVVAAYYCGASAPASPGNVQLTGTLEPGDYFLRSTGNTAASECRGVGCGGPPGNPTHTREFGLSLVLERDP